jgi:putative serine protease PepD
VGTSSIPAVSSPTVSTNQSATPDGSVQQVATAILPSVVSVLASSAGSAGEGSGVILSSDGLILTNNHVISGASTLQVHFFDGSTARASVIGADVTDDLAVIKAASVSGLIPATLGTSRDLQVGQGVVAVGSPLGLSATVTAGIVSALNRPVRTSDQQQSPRAGQGQSTVLNAVQTDAAINPGNSGGPLVDMSAKVIGINSAIASLSSSATSQAGSIGVGFAIPIDQATRIAQEIIQTGTATHAVFGASVDDATTGGSTLLTSGATITQLAPGGPAEAAGLQVNDVITTVGGQQVESADALIAAIRSAPPNTAVDITYSRGTSSNTVTVTLGSATA